MSTGLGINADLLTATQLAEIRELLAKQVLARIVGGQYEAAVLADGPSGYYRLGEASGTTAFDASGNGYHGTYVNGPTLGVASLLSGDPDKAVTFAVSPEQYVQINGLLGDLGSSLGTATVEFWIKSAATTVEQVLEAVNDFGGPQGGGFTVYLNSDNAAASLVTGSTGFVIQDDALNAAAFSITEDIYDNAPHHVVFQVTDLTPTASALAWVDGVSVAVTPTVGNSDLGTTSNFTSSANLKIADGLDGDTLDEVAFYSTRLSSDRVLAHYEAGTTRPTPSATDLATNGTTIRELQTTLGEAKELIDSLAEIAP